MHDVQSYHVDWLVTDQAVADVTVHLVNGQLQSVEAGRTRDAIAFGPVALVSGLVNTHTHLEFSGFKTPIPTSGRFTDWIRAVVAHRRNHPESVSNAIRSGLRESVESGTTLLGEIATVGWTWDDYLAEGFRGVVFQELLGLLPERVTQQQELGRRHVRGAIGEESDEMVPHPGPPAKPERWEERNGRRAARRQLDCDSEPVAVAREKSPHPGPLPARPGRGEQRGMAAGLSPHAPYSTHLNLVAEAVELAVATGCPLAMHLAETRAELALLREHARLYGEERKSPHPNPLPARPGRGHKTRTISHGDFAEGHGEFRELLTDFGLWRDDPSWFGRRPLDYLKILSGAPSALIVHGNYLDDDELQFLATQPQMTLVYCPRTHAAFGHPDHPWLRAREMGVRIALGTDSRASNPDLSLFAELQFLAARTPQISHIDLLQIGSIAGRRALGFEQGPEANLTLVQLTEQGMQHPERQLFMPDHRVAGTMVNGKWIWLATALQKIGER